MSSRTAEPASMDQERAELQAVLQSELFMRSPTLAHLLSHLCEKTFAGESSRIKEYTIAVEVFGRRDSFDQETDSIVRVQANRLRKRLAEYYGGEGANHCIQISVPVGQYVPLFEEKVPLATPTSASAPRAEGSGDALTVAAAGTKTRAERKILFWAAILGAVVVVGVVAWILRGKLLLPGREGVRPGAAQQITTEPPVGLPVGEEVRILAGEGRSYVDRAGKMWGPDAHFGGGTPVRSSVQHIWRTQDPSIYRSSRQGDFTYDIPLKPGIYELHLHFAETFYGPDDMGGGGEGSRIMTVTANGAPLLTDFDLIADAGGSRTADVKVFTDVHPASDGKLHLAVTSARGGGVLSAIEVLPGVPGRIRPVRIVTREVPYYSNDSHWWSPDIYFKGGQLTGSERPASDTDDPELYETERWGHFSYAIPVIPGKYALVLHFVERRFDRPSPANSGGRVFSVFCNGMAVLRDLNIADKVGKDRPLEQKITGLEPNAQGKLLLEFVPTRYYATLSAIEVIPQ